MSVCVYMCGGIIIHVHHLSAGEGLHICAGEWGVTVCGTCWCELRYVQAFEWYVKHKHMLGVCVCVCVRTVQLYSMYIFVYLHTCADSSEATYVCVCVCAHHQPPVQSDSFECPGKGYHVCTYMALACTFVYIRVSCDLGR